MIDDALAWKLEQIRVEPQQFTNSRVIMLHTVRGTMYLPLEEATAILIKLTAALERAIDPTPLPEPEIVTRPRPTRRPTNPTTNLEDLA